MSVIHIALHRAYDLVDCDIHGKIHKRFEFQKQTLKYDETLTADEKHSATEELGKAYDKDKVKYNDGIRRTCDYCGQKCLASSFCELCVRNYLKSDFSNWTSGNNDIDKLIQKCQLETIKLNAIVEWIPYNRLQDIKYFTKGGFSEIYTAIWIDGHHVKWDSKNQKLERFGKEEVVIKKLENVESINQISFKEVNSHLSLSNKSVRVVKGYGLTKDPNGNYMLVMKKMDTDLRTYLEENRYELTWKEGIHLAADIIEAFERIHEVNEVHRDLHSGNVLYEKKTRELRISDLGFCGPANKSSESIYGNLPYIAPEVISGKNATKASDIYSIAMLMWEISSGQPPFINHEHDYDLAMNIINGIRPKIVSGTPLEYESLMKQCWDADPSKRPDIRTLWEKMKKIYKAEINNNSKMYKMYESNYTNRNTSTSTSKVHQFENLPEPRNATEEEQEAFHSKSYDFSIPDNIDDFKKNSSVIQQYN